MKPARYISIVMSRLKRFHVALAACLIVIGLLINPWFVSDSLNGSISRQDTIVTVAFEIFLIVSGLLVYFKGKTPEGRKLLAFGFVSLLLVILVVETGLHIIDWAIHRSDEETNSEIVDSRVLLEPYEGKEWANDYWREYLEVFAETKYEPFLGFHRPEYHGQYIDIDHNSVRKTWNPERSDGEVPGTIYMFGASTIWGDGARDEYTIPSYLSKILHTSGYNFTVTNYGQPAYTSTQEIMRLILLLRDGHRPDYVLFYDGIGDVMAAEQSGIPGSPIQLNLIRAYWKWLSFIKPWDAPTQSISYVIVNRVLELLADHSIIYKAIGNIPGVEVTIDPYTQSPCTGERSSDEDLQLLADGIAEYYLTSMELLDQLAQAYGFEYICYWQPVTFLEKQLTEEEAKFTEPYSLCQVDLPFLHRMTHESLFAKSVPPNLFDITDTLSGRTKTYYIDVNHICEEGNEVVATRMFEIFEDLFLKE
jgi:lysophospholipase L1-like esterase